mmetsp:Transcript_47246/g.75450  ORF Transcript_47246/g.75450 Transcript_47246/m.75450 type:complete len:88 (+) Transcript_47246:21-284(+)
MKCGGSIEVLLTSYYSGASSMLAKQLMSCSCARLNIVAQPTTMFCCSVVVADTAAAMVMASMHSQQEHRQSAKSAEMVVVEASVWRS